VKNLLQELVERLLSEASNEATQKGWCDKGNADAEQKRGYAQDKVDDLKAKMGIQKARSDKMKEELGVLKGDMKKLSKNVAEAKAERKAEEAENKNTVADAKEGIAATKKAADILDKFYKTAANAGAKAPVSGAYSGQNVAASGILAMMEVIESDFHRTVSQTLKAEEASKQQLLEFMTESGKSLAEKKVATGEKRRWKDETEKSYEENSDNLSSQSKIVKTSTQELAQMKAACSPKGQSYKERVAAREQEVESLKKGLCILNAGGSAGDC